MKNLFKEFTAQFVIIVAMILLTVVCFRVTPVLDSKIAQSRDFHGLNYDFVGQDLGDHKIHAPLSADFLYAHDLLDDKQAWVETQHMLAKKTPLNDVHLQAIEWRMSEPVALSHDTLALVQWGMDGYPKLVNAKFWVNLEVLNFMGLVMSLVGLFSTVFLVLFELRQAKIQRDWDELFM